MRTHATEICLAEHYNDRYPYRLFQTWRRGTPEPKLFVEYRCRVCPVAEYHRIDAIQWRNYKALGVLVTGVEYVQP